MAGQNLDHFLEPANAEAFDNLSDDDKARLFAGESIEGDTTSTDIPSGEENSETPAAVAQVGTEEGEQGDATGDDPVIVAKDGKHTIPYQELLDARETAKQLEQQIKEQGEQLAKLQQSAEAAPVPVVVKATETPPAMVDIDALERAAGEAWIEGDADKAVDLRRQINAELMRRAEENVQSAIEQKTAQNTEAGLFSTTVTKSLERYPFLDAKAETANPEAIKEVVEFRDVYIAQGFASHEALAKAVAKIGPFYEKPPAAEVTKPTPEADAATLAAAAIAQIKQKVPISLSEVPAGSTAPHDEAEAIREMSGLSLMNKFHGKTPDQIMELMSRVI